MLNIKKLLKIGDVKIIKRKIKIYNILNGINYTINSLGIFEYFGKLNYCGIPIDKIKFSKLKEYKRNYSIIKRWLNWILNNSEKVDEKINYKHYFYKENYILNLNLKNKIFWISDNKIWSKIYKKSNYNNYIANGVLKSILEDYFKIRVNIIFTHYGK